MEKESLKESANTEKMTEGGLVLRRPDEGRGMVEKIRQARAGVEDVFDVGDLGGRTRESRKANSA
jgi:hypothetical protein